MTYYYENDTEGCLIILTVLALAGFIWFGMPYVCMLGWAPIAAAWNLPTFTYWNWFWMSWMIRWLFKGSGTGKETKLERKR